MERILQKIGRLNEYIKVVESIRHDCERRFDTDVIYRGAMLYYLYMVADTAIALAEMVIKQKGLRTPQSYSEAFDILGEGGVLETEFAHNFARIAGFRNFLAHDYERIESAIICGDILDSLTSVKSYIQQVALSCGIEISNDS